MDITFIGHSTCIPDVGTEMASFLIDGKHLVDTGWCGALTMRELGHDPLNLESLVITHFHQDHYLGLPHLLFYMGLKGKRDRPLTILGPAQHLKEVVRTSEAFLQLNRFPELRVTYNLIPLQAGERYETRDLLWETFPARHVSGEDATEEALVYKVTDKLHGACVAFTGDTHHHPPIADFANGATLLIHDGAHTAPEHAAQIAEAAGVERLLLIHYAGAQGEQKLSAARAVFPNTDLARQGDTVTVSPS